MFSATGTRGSLTMPHSMASISEKSLIVQGKSVPSRVAGAVQEEGRGREVEDAREPQRAVHGFETGDPQAGGLVVLLGFLPLVALQRLFVRIRRLLPVAVVRLVVQRQHVLHAHQLGHHALEHLSFGFERLQLRTGRALEERTSAGGELEPLAAFEGVVVRDDDPRLLDVLEQVVRDQLARAVVVVRVVRLQDAQAIADGQAGCDDEKAAGEVFAAGPANGVERLPGDQHRHDGRLAGARGELQREPLDLRIRVGVDRLQVVEQSFARRQMRRDFGEPDRRFDRLDLTEERSDAAELVMSPVLKESCRLRRHLPLAGRQIAPRVDLRREPR